MKDYSFGNFICALRTGLGLSQFQLGTLVGVTDKAVSKWENGDAKPRVATCYRLAEVLGISIDELLSCEKHDTSSARKELDKMDHELWKIAYEKLYEIYGSQPPAVCWSRLASEEMALRDTDAIQGFAVLGKIEEEARKQNCLTIVAGDTNSSFAAWLFGGTRVNPLPPHYRCPKCKRTIFVDDVRDGFDLEPMRCSCGMMFDRDGHDLPYEGFAKTEHDYSSITLRVPDSFRPTVFKVISDHYAGTADILPVRMDEREIVSSVERYLVVPMGKTLPPRKEDGAWHTGLDEYWTWHGREPVFDIVSNQQLEQIVLMQRRIGCRLPDVTEIIDADMAEQLFQEKKKQVPSITDVLAADERHDFDLLIRIDAMRHASGAWAGNGLELVQSGRAPFRMLAACREDVWTAVAQGLMGAGVTDRGSVLQIMEDVRKGRYERSGMPACIESLLLRLGLPEWYPDHLKKIRYLFPKGHCIVYTMVDMIYHWLRMRQSDEVT